MANQLFAKAKKMVLSAHRKGNNSVTFCGITMRIRLAHDDNYMVLLPDGSELFRIVGKGEDAIIIS